MDTSATERQLAELDQCNRRLKRQNRLLRILAALTTVLALAAWEMASRGRREV